MKKLLRNKILFLIFDKDAKDFAEKLAHFCYLTSSEKGIEEIKLTLEKNSYLGKLFLI